LQGANHVMLRDLNTDTVFRTIQTSGTLARTDIVELTGLAPSTVSVITGELQERNLIRETGFASSTGGRRPILLEINPEGGYFICANLEGVRLSIGVLDLALHVVQEWEFPMAPERGERLYIQLVGAIAEIRTLCDERGLSLLGIGIATPGMLAPDTGKIVEADNLGWYDLELRRLLEERFALPVIVENDTNAAAYGELLSAPHGYIRNMLYVSIGTGIGAGLVLNGQLYTGSQGMAGEIGHVMAAPGGKRCRCGKRGCLETIATEWAMLQEYNDCSPVAAVQAQDVGWLLKLAKHDELAREIVENAGRAVGVIVGNQINVLNVDSLIFGGVALCEDSPMLAAIAAGLKLSLLPKLHDHIAMRASTFGSRAAYVGVAHMCTAQLFSTQNSNM